MTKFFEKRDRQTDRQKDRESERVEAGEKELSK